jgi:alpha-beta hydrolase superfamily lysophospholipase
MSVLLALILVIILFMISLSVVLLVIGPVMLLQPYRRTIEYYRQRTALLHPTDAGLPSEEFTLKTAEGITLSCWFIKAQAPVRGTVIILHGVSESKIVGLPLARALHAEHFNVFLYDSRRHGESGGRFCTYGFYEKHDVSIAISYMEHRRDVELGNVGLMGSSMGAAVAIQAAALDKRIKAVVAESGFATLRTVFDDYQKRMIKMPWHYLRNLVIKRSEHLAHFKASAVAPLEAVREIHVPLFILHGTTDDRISHHYSLQVFENANQPKDLWLLEDAQHHNVADVGGEEYTKRILEFFKKNLSPRPA